MVEFRWIQMSLFLILMLQFPATTGQYLSVTARVGHDVTLSCGNVIHGQKNCSSTTWIFNHSPQKPSVVLVDLGQIRSKPDRLRVTTNCSLVIKNVTDDDVGHYSCRQLISGRQQGADCQVHLSVITMTEHEDNDKVVLFCSVLDDDPCRHTVEWLYEGKEEISDMEISPPSCSDPVTFTSSHLNQRIYELLKCKVTDVYTNEVQLFTFSPQSSAPHNSWSKLHVIVCVSLAAFFIVVFFIAIIKWRKTKGNKRDSEKHTEMSSNSAETQSGPTTSQDTAQPEDDVCYASISYTKKTKSKAKAQVCGDDDDKGGSVIYSAVKASSSTSSGGFSTDPRNLDSTVSKPNR